MAFALYKTPNGTYPTERFIASGAVAVGAPVAIAAGASGAELAKVSQLAGGSNATEHLYGVAIHAAIDGAEVLVIPVDSRQVWVADAAANTNVSNAAQDNYLTTTTLTLVVGASTVNGRKCEIVGQLGATGDRKYLVRLGNYDKTASAPAVSTVVAYTLDQSAGAFSAAAAAVFTAPYAMRIDEVIVNAQATSGSGTVNVMKGTDAICTAITCDTDGAVTRMSAGAVVANKARLVLAAGDVVNAQAVGGTATNIRGIITIFGHRI